MPDAFAKQQQLNTKQIVFDQDAGATGQSTPIGVNLPTGVRTFDAWLDVDAGGTGNVVLNVEGRVVAVDGTKGAWLILATGMTAAAGVAVIAAVEKADEYRVDVTTAQTGAPGNFRVFIAL